MRPSVLAHLREQAKRIDTLKATPAERREAERRAAKTLVLVINELTDDEADARMHDLIAEKLVEIRNEAKPS